jgi:hypothetical protein
VCAFCRLRERVGAISIPEIPVELSTPVDLSTAPAQE